MRDPDWLWKDLRESVRVADEDIKYWKQMAVDALDARIQQKREENKRRLMQLRPEEPHRTSVQRVLWEVEA